MLATTSRVVAASSHLTDQLRRELAALIESIDEMRTRSGPLLAARYQAALGRLELQLLEIQLEIRMVRRRHANLLARVNLGKPVTQSVLGEIDRSIEAEVARWREQVVARERALVDAAQLIASVTLADAQEAPRVKAAYRRLARLLHPDASPEHGSLFEKYWSAVQESYCRVDAVLIEALLHLVEHAIAERDALPAIDDDTEVTRLRALVAAHAERLARLKREPPHCYADRLMDDAWVASHQAMLEEHIAAESCRLAQLVIRQTDLLAQLGVAPRPVPGDRS
ncbi:MAG: hypothetical protein IPF74_06795 [Rhodocyclaceae bacterium]|nr:hypothetical protein [Rhodocyclaceae bacterium]